MIVNIGLVIIEIVYQYMDKINKLNVDTKSKHFINNVVLCMTFVCIWTTLVSYIAWGHFTHDLYTKYVGYTV